MWLNLVVVISLLVGLPWSLEQGAPDEEEGEEIGLVTDCNDPGSCYRKQCTDTHAEPPVKCHGHNAVMDCFRSCFDTQELLDCYREHQKNETQEYCVLKYGRRLLYAVPDADPTATDGTLLHPGIPCQLKCQIDPLFWTCTQDCDQRGCLNSFKVCETAGGSSDTVPCNPEEEEYWMKPNCTDCYVKRLITELETSHDCVYRYSATHLNVTGPDSGHVTYSTPPFQRSQCVYPAGTLSNVDIPPEKTKVYKDIMQCVQRASTAAGSNTSTESSITAGGAKAKATIKARHVSLKTKARGRGASGLSDNYVSTCFNQFLMKRQLKSCLKGGYHRECAGKRGPDSMACQRLCLKVMMKPYCYIPCKINQEYAVCRDNCGKRWPTSRCLCSAKQESYQEIQNFFSDINARLSKYAIRTTNCSNHFCYASGIHADPPEDPQLEPNPDDPYSSTAFDGWNRKDVEERNCKSKRFNNEFAKKLLELFPGAGTATFSDDIGDLAIHYTFLECREKECSTIAETDLGHCTQLCMQKLRTTDEMGTVCESFEDLSKAENQIGNFLRSEILMYCLLEVDNTRHWSIKELLKVSQNVLEYQSIFQCEQVARQHTGNVVSKQLFLLGARINYEIEKDWCEGCSSAEEENQFFSYDLDHAKCLLNECYRAKEGQACPPLERTDSIVYAMISTQCTWKVDFSQSRAPHTIWSTYFDELAPHDETNSMQGPNTIKYLVKSTVSSTRGHYVFPYFLVIRGTCEDGGFYSEEIYKFIESGGVPVVNLKFVPQAARLKYTSFVSAAFPAALINLDRKTERDRLYIPQNPLNRPNTDKEYDGKTGCHLNICYPAFVVPQVFLYLPIIEVGVSSQARFKSVKYVGYTATLHVRDISGQGRLKVADHINPPTADLFFPRDKVRFEQDTQLAQLWHLLPDSGLTNVIDQFPGPELEHLTDHNCVPFPTKIGNSEDQIVGGNPFFPLDSEDFFRIQFTYGIAPHLVVAGFYDPSLVLVGDPDMRRIEMVKWRWGFEDAQEAAAEEDVAQSQSPCLLSHNRVHGYPKPMYSHYDRFDPEYWIQHYRTRYSPKNYTKDAVHIFDAMALEDRILLVTNHGIASFYGNMNGTSAEGKAWTWETASEETQTNLPSCFKIVRLARRLHTTADTIIAISYNYQEPDYGGEKWDTLRDINQQLWIGKYWKVGQAIQWEQIATGEVANSNSAEEKILTSGDDGVVDTATLSERKIVGLPASRGEAKPKSQIEAICFKAFRTRIQETSEFVELIEDSGWCEAIDATPVVAFGNRVQLLVRMRTYFSGARKLTQPVKVNGTYVDRDVSRLVMFYILASFNTDNTRANPHSSIWTIDAVIPRVPCVDHHKESIPNVVQFSKEYFNQGDSSKNHGCHTVSNDAVSFNKLYLHGLTYTRTYSHHLFLYGNKLLQSTDGGKTIVLLRSFPHKPKAGEYKCDPSGESYHRIKHMAFDDLGHYAFLTSKRELWYGNLGSLDQIRLRPGLAYSMMLARLPQVQELNDAVPFAVFFDTNNELVEIVAIVDKTGTATRITRRSINERTIIRAKHFTQQISRIGEISRVQLKTAIEKGEKNISKELYSEMRYNEILWSAFCPFSSPRFYQNYSHKHDRLQSLFFPHPEQHNTIGLVHGRTSLLTFQAITFGLVWNSLVNVPYRTFSGLDQDPFKSWVEKKRDTAVVAKLAYLNGDPAKSGIYVHPEKFRRFDTRLEASKRFISVFALDYGTIVRVDVEYSISNDFTLNPIDYGNHDLSAIHLNVENSNGQLIQINTDKEIIASKAAVRYVIHITVKRNSELKQRLPGHDPIHVPINLHLIGGFGRCIPSDSSGSSGDALATTAAVGCPPSQDLVFDWQSTVHSIKFRDLTAHYGVEVGDCYNKERFCFFARYPMVMHFHVFDEPKQEFLNFSGKYTMRVIAGGYSKDNLIPYSREQQDAFNVPGVSDVSLIWNEFDRTLHYKKSQSADYGKDKENVLQAGVSAIQWVCHSLSPCARVTPRPNLESVYYFKLFVSNRDVDNSTLCLFEKEFTILLYGFPPSPGTQMIISSIFFMVTLTVVYIAYFCLRNHKKLWRATTHRVWGWYLIFRETLPKSWFKPFEEDEEQTALNRQRWKDEIILSLQGHLGVPKLVPKRTIPGETKRSQGALAELQPSASTGDVTSSLSSVPSSLRNVTGKSTRAASPIGEKRPTSIWTDLIHEQVISRRLATVLERNRKKAEELRNKAFFKKPPRRPDRSSDV